MSNKMVLLTISSDVDSTEINNSEHFNKFLCVVNLLKYYQLLALQENCKSSIFDIIMDVPIGFRSVTLLFEEANNTIIELLKKHAGMHICNHLDYATNKVVETKIRVEFSISNQNLEFTVVFVDYDDVIWHNEKSNNIAYIGRNND